MPNYPQAKARGGPAADYYKDCGDISLWKMVKHTGLRVWLQGVGHTASTSSFPHFNYGWLEARCCHRPQIKLKYDKAEISGPGPLPASGHVRRRHSPRNYNICQYFFDERFDMNDGGRGGGVTARGKKCISQEVLLQELHGGWGSTASPLCTVFLLMEDRELCSTPPPCNASHPQDPTRWISSGAPPSLPC